MCICQKEMQEGNKGEDSRKYGRKEVKKTKNNLPNHPIKSRDASVGIALGYGLDDRGFESRQGLGIFLFATASRPALGPTQLPIHWVPRALSLGVMRPVRKADHPPPSSAEVKNTWSYTSTLPIRLRGVVLC
jgi:hypothetical protein